MPLTRVIPQDVLSRAGAKPPRLPWHRARVLPAVRMPLDERRRRAWTALSVLLHVLVIALLLRPEAILVNPDLVEIDQGGGGPGPAGGGGGGTRGTGGVKFVTIAQPQPAAPVIVPPVETPKAVVAPVIEPPKPVVPEPSVPQPELPKVAEPAKAEVKVQSPIVGTGGGSGTDGTTGNGPGSGGGVGSGTGTGRGSGDGPGTGGGDLKFYPAKLIDMPIPPLPQPKSVHGRKIIVNFDVDERGRVLKIEMNGSGDGDYDRKLNALFKTFKFRPATTLEGVPMRAIYQMTMNL